MPFVDCWSGRRDSNPRYRLCLLYTSKDHADICVLVTGGAGFIGSHTCVELLDQGYHVVVVDDLSNSSELALDRVRQITGLAANDDRLKFYEANILDRAALDRVFSENDVDAIIHFAGFKAVGESVQKPLEYYWNNFAGTLAPVSYTHLDVYKRQV